MTVDEIKELIQVVNESGISELEVQRGENRVRIRRAPAHHAQEFVLPAAPVIAPVAPHMATAASSISHTPQSAAQLSAAPDTVEPSYVKSPIVGTYYDAPSPGAPPFVKVGDRVTTGQVLCIIESMKLMNEIESEVSGILAAKLVENGRPVEYGEALFAVQPS